MRSPKNMEIIQIDITNACPHMCSNCTRFCGHHAKPFFMSFDTFKRAVDSLQEFPNMVGVIGGEPTVHPEFEKFADYLRKSRVGGGIIPVMRKPVPAMLDFILTRLGSLHNKLGLWSSLNKTYYKHFETIHDTFPSQFLNDHDNACLHQALLMPRKELGISDEEWIQKRDACWIQNTWSATITPKGAFFCEVAGSLDMLFDGPGGWEVDSDWWKRTPEEFGEQLEWCELCSGCLDVPKRISNDERDDMTPTMYERLKAMKSPKIAKKKFFVHEPSTFDKSLYHTFTGSNDYMNAAGNVRTTNRNRDYYPKNFVHVTPANVNQVLLQHAADDWIIMANTLQEAEAVAGYFSNVVLNPGCVYLTGNAVVFNVNAKALRNFSGLQNNNIWNYYPPDKIISVDLNEAVYDKMVVDCLESVPHGSNIAIFGAEPWGRKLFSKLLDSGLYRVCAWVDTRNFGWPVLPANLDYLTAADYIVVAFPSNSTCQEINELLQKHGIESQKIRHFCLQP